jgi:hypothetical protein
MAPGHPVTKAFRMRPGVYFLQQLPNPGSLVPFFLIIQRQPSLLREECRLWPETNRNKCQIRSYRVLHMPRG